jgi:hypothetical protein
MGATTGIQAIADFTGMTDTDAMFDALIALIPDPDTRESPSPRESGSMLDEMSPMAAAQLRVELEAAKVFANAGTVPGV